MISGFYDKQLFSKLFTLGLLLLFIGILEENFRASGQINYFIFDSLIFLSVGAILCLISFLFLLTEWVVLPFGTQTKRIKLYQGLGNLLAFAMLIGGWVCKEDVSQNLTSSLSLSFSSGGLIIAILFGWVGSNIANYISRKKINLDESQDKLPSHNNQIFSRENGRGLNVSGNKITPDMSRIPAVQN